MKKIFFITTFIFVFGFALLPNFTFAQGMMAGFSNSSADWEEVVEHTAREEQEGKKLWGQLQAKEIACENLSNEQFGVLGEYFMGQMAGNSHAAMNAMMIQMRDEEGEEQIHIVMGMRISGCNTSTAFPAISDSWMPMINMMWGGWSSPFNSNNSTNNMMNFGFIPFVSFGWIFMILWWVLIIVGIIALIKWFTNQSRDTHNREKSALEILQERYAKGEIDKKEFEEKKKDLV